MSWNGLILFSLIVMCASAVKYRPILLQITSGTSYCNNEKLFSNFDLNEVSQFGAMCNIQVPKNNQVDLLLENNVVPILCMGLYDVSLRLCKSASDNTFMEIFPPSEDKFSKLFNTLHNSEVFSSLNTFCSSTVKNFTITESASNITEFWWNILNQQLKDETTCKTICRTSENNKVQPLCSYIIWSNGVYLNHQKNQVESQSTAIGEYPVNEGLEKKVDPLKKVAEESTANVDNPPSFMPTVEIMNSVSSPPLAPNPPVSQDMKSEGQNTSKQGGSVSGKSEQSVTVQQKGEETAAAKASPDKSSNNTDTKPSDKTATSKVTEVKKDQAVKKPVVPSAQETPKPPEASVDQSLKAGEGSAVPAVTAAQTLDQPKSDKAADNMVEGDFSFEVTPEGVGLDPPIVADKDVPQPYSDEEVEDGDGDDVDIEPEGPVKTNPNRTGPSKAGVIKPSSAASDQGAAEPDKVYGEEREIIIEDHFIEAEDSHFFTYFLCMAVLTIMAYLVFHNKKKLVALAVEGRRTRGSRHRPNSSNYSKLDCSLEEALVSKTTASVTHVLY